MHDEKYRRCLISVASIFVQFAAIAGAAAAELPIPTKAPPVAVPTWTGFYLGADVGGGFSQKSFINNFSAPLGAVDASPRPSGWVGGFQGGYNYQIDRLVLGIEGDFDWSGATSSVSCFPLLAPQTCTADPRWLGILAGRLGTVVGPALLYAKGGAAWIHDSYSDIALPGAPGPAIPGDLFVAHETRAGWDLGAGIEYMFLPNWSARLEYDYLGFPDRSVTFDDNMGNSFTELIHQNMQLVTVGLNYHFPVVAAAPPPIVTKAH